jgi:hypothetical protein
MNTSTMLVKEGKLEDKELTDPTTEVVEEEEVAEVETELTDHQEETKPNKQLKSQLLKLQSKKLELTQFGIDYSISNLN